MDFAALTTRRHTRAALRYSSNAAGKPTYAYFPAAAGVRAEAFPTAIVCQVGAPRKQDKDLLTGLNRADRTLTISLTTSALPAVFRDAMNFDKIPRDQVLKVGHTLATATTYRVASTTSNHGLTNIELEQQL